MSKMKPEIKALWVEALTSNEYEQAHNTLRVSFGLEAGGVKPAFCCLGVACDLYQKNVGGRWDRDAFYANNVQRGMGTPPTVVAEWMGLTSVNPNVVMMDDATGELEERSVAEWNDGHCPDGRQRTFAEIAAAVQEQL